jgi:hypothetical protein
MYTSLVLVALAGGSASPAVPDPSWQEDYAAARKLGRQERKPLAVFIGAGREGWGKVSESGKLNPAVKRRLADDYVCLYLNRARPSGWRVASAFRMSGPGLVISSPDGEDQAFRHEGTLSSSELEWTLRKYANPRRVVTRTETIGGGTVQVSDYSSPQQDTTTLQTTLPAAGVAAPTVPLGLAPSMGFGGGGFGGFGGGFGGGGGGGRGGC